LGSRIFGRCRAHCAALDLCFLDDLFVLPEVRGTRLGEALIQATTPVPAGSMIAWQKRPIG
jgi:hypothetical protein